MTIRPAVMADFDEISAIFARARRFMAEAGTPGQWNTTYPPADLIRADITSGAARVCEVEGRIQCVFSVFPQGDPIYDTIYGGTWPDGLPYCAVHRVASRGEVRGIAGACLHRCVEQYGRVRIDTHADNRPMQRTLEKQGFVRCGLVFYPGDGERICYQAAK